MSSNLFARESLAGRSRTALSSGIVTLVGAGAAGNNIAQTLALEGVGELRIIDFDTIEPSNATRSPLFPKKQVAEAPGKAETLAHSVARLSYAERPVVRYGNAKVEDLGLGAFVGSGAIVPAVDSLPVRAYLADVARLLGIPLVEIGFGFPVGQVSVYKNEAADEVCWRCNRADASTERASCSWYARKMAEDGKVPATQTLAAALSALAAEAVIQALHGRFPLAGRRFHLNVETGASDLVTVRRDPECAGVHRLHEAIAPLPVTVDAALPEVFAALKAMASDPAVRLSGLFVREAPCALCGSCVRLNAPARTIAEPPRCSACVVPASTVTPILAFSTIAEEDAIELALPNLRALGFAPGTVIEIEDRSSGNISAVKLAGELGELFTTIDLPPASTMTVT